MLLSQQRRPDPGQGFEMARVIAGEAQHEMAGARPRIAIEPFRNP
jgi:hypothetical protein